MPICDYGCGQEAKYQFKNGKWCCSEKWQSCAANRERVRKQNIGENNPIFGKKHSNETRNKISLKAFGRKPWNKGKSRSERVKKILSKKLKGRDPWNKGIIAYSCRRTIKQIKEKYSFFSKIEEMRYSPDKPIEEREIQVHCKNHNCSNSKEKNGWFTSTGRQLESRINALENNGRDNSYFYCSQECKQECPLYNLQSDPFKSTEKSYTQSEYQTFREHVLKRDDYICQYCGKLAEQVHHERPQKLEPFFTLDPDLAWSVCSNCHYEYGHKDECSTGKLSQIVCSS